MKWAQKYKNSTRGFTIVELLIVVVVIAILAAITIVSYNGISQSARNSADKSELVSFSRTLQIMAIDGADFTSKAVWKEALQKSGLYATTESLSLTDMNSRGIAFCATASEYIIFSTRPPYPKSTGMELPYLHSGSGWQTLIWNDAAAGDTVLDKFCTQAHPSSTARYWAHSAAIRTPE